MKERRTQTTQLPAKIEQRIEETVLQSGLDETNQVLLRKELRSHFFEKTRDLIDADTETLAAQAAVGDFGDPKAIGREMFYSYNPYLRIPFIGPLLYYRSVRLGLVYFLLFLFCFFAMPLVLGFGPNVVGIYPLGDYFEKAAMLSPLILAFIAGIVTRKGKQPLTCVLAGSLLSLVPIAGTILVVTAVGIFYAFTFPVTTYTEGLMQINDTVRVESSGARYVPFLLYQVVWCMSLVLGRLISEIISVVPRIKITFHKK